MEGLEENFGRDADSGGNMFFEDLIEEREGRDGVGGIDGFNVDALRERGESTGAEFDIGEIDGVASEDVIKIEISLRLNEEKREEGFDDSGGEFSEREPVKLFDIDDDGSEERNAANLISAEVLADVKEVRLIGLVSGEDGVEGSRSFAREVISDGNGVKSVTLVEAAAVYRSTT